MILFTLQLTCKLKCMLFLSPTQQSVNSLVINFHSLILTKQFCYHCYLEQIITINRCLLSSLFNSDSNFALNYINEPKIANSVITVLTRLIWPVHETEHAIYRKDLRSFFQFSLSFKYTINSDYSIICTITFLHNYPICIVMLVITTYQSYKMYRIWTHNSMHNYKLY